MNSNSRLQLATTTDAMSSEIAFDSSSDKGLKNQQLKLACNYQNDVEMSPHDVEECKVNYREPSQLKNSSKTKLKQVMIQSRDVVSHDGDKTDPDTIMNESKLLSTGQLYSDFGMAHPSAHLRDTTTEIERQNINVESEFGKSILDYTK